MGRRPVDFCICRVSACYRNSGLPHATKGGSRKDYGSDGGLSLAGLADMTRLLPATQRLLDLTERRNGPCPKFPQQPKGSQQPKATAEGVGPII